MPLVTCQNLSLGYDGKTVVEGLTFSVDEGEYLCIVGENGSGKSTLLKTLLGLLSPIKGEVLLGEGLRQTEIGYLPQQTAIQKDFPASVKEVVLSGCLNQCGMRPFYGREEKRRAYALMEQVGIAELAKRSYRSLSGGQQQRVLLARALCATTKLLVLDEPVTGLDPKASADMYRTIKTMHEEKGIAVIMISHDVDTAIQYATHVLHLGNHQTLFFGDAESYSESDVVKRLGYQEGGPA